MQFTKYSRSRQFHANASQALKDIRKSWLDRCKRNIPARVVATAHTETHFVFLARHR